MQLVSHRVAFLWIAFWEHLHKKKCFLSGIARMRGGGRTLHELKIHYIYLFLTAEKDVQAIVVTTGIKPRT